MIYGHNLSMNLNDILRPLAMLHLHFCYDILISKNYQYMVLLLVQITESLELCEMSFMILKRNVKFYSLK